MKAEESSADGSVAVLPTVVDIAGEPPAVQPPGRRRYSLQPSSFILQPSSFV
jgi:hypothetical protein